MKLNRTAVTLLPLALALALAAGPAQAKKENRYGIEGNFISYDQETQTFKVLVTSRSSKTFGGSIAGGKAPKDIKRRAEMTLAVKPTGSVLTRTVVKSAEGTGLDNSGTQEGFSQAVRAIPTDKRVTFSIERNPAAKSNPKAPAYRIKTVIIQLTPEELEQRWKELTGEDD